MKTHRLALALLLAGCSENGSSTAVEDTAVADTAVVDSIAPLDTGATDTSTTDTAVADTGGGDTAVADTGGGDSGGGDTGGADSGAADSGAADTAVADSGADVGAGDTGLADTGLVDAGAKDSAADAIPVDTGPADPCSPLPTGLTTWTKTDSASSGTPDTYFFDVNPGDPFCATITGGGSGAWSVNVSNGTSAGLYCSGGSKCSILVPAGQLTLLVTAVTTDIGSYTLTVRYKPR